MAITLVRNQLVDSIINENKLDSGAVSFAKMKSADLETNLASSASASKLATAAAIKAYVDAQVPDSFSGGDGIVIDASGDPDVIAVDLATNPGLQFTSNKLDLKCKAETGGTITKDANGIYLADSAVSNAKLANSTISGKALGANLDSLSAGQGISMSAYNGSAAVSDLWYISQLYVDQINGMMVRCDDDRKMYQDHMLRLSEQLDVMSADIKDIKDAKVDK